MSTLTKSAKGQPCQVRIAGVCNFDDSTTVLAHLNGAGMGIKSLDIHGAFSCSSCHFWLDGGYAGDASRDYRDLCHYQGIIRTQRIWVQMGLLEF